jgi:hypothetical protein
MNIHPSEWILKSEVSVMVPIADVASPSRQTNRDTKWETYCNS